MRRMIVVVGLSVGMAVAGVAQDKPQPLAVGTLAPDFTLSGATKDGVLSHPVTLSELRGHTVVLAFFPKARTGGCTIQMDAYRDQDAKLFGGKDVKVFAISADADTAQASWAKDKGYTVTFLSDLGAEVGKQYGTAMNYPKFGWINARILYVIDPSGKIVHVMSPFRETDPTAYTELGSWVTKVTAGGGF